MDAQRTAVDNTPLLVNLLRLIRNARSPNFKDHEKGPVTFHFGGLCMRDTGGYAEAEELWRRASLRGATPAGQASAATHAFRGPLYIAVFLNKAPVEVWTLQDYRDPSTEHSVPRDFEQLEQLNTLVRVLFAHLRCQEIYGVVLQSCVTAADDAGGNGAADDFESRAHSSPLSPLAREATSASVPSPQSPLNQVSLRLYDAADDCPTIPASAQKQYLWSSEDFVRVDVVVNRAWRYQTAPPPPLPNTVEFPSTAAVAVLERSSPIQTRSPASRTQAGDSDAPSPSTSPEFLGSLAKSSLPTPHLAPASTSPSSVNRQTGVSPMSRISPLLTTHRKSPMPAMSDFVLPPPEISDLFDADAVRQSRSSPLGPYNPSIFSSVVGSATAKSNALASPLPAASTQPQPAVPCTVGHLEDVMQLSEAEHVRLMGTLVSAGKDTSSSSPSTSASMSPLGTRRRPSAAHVGGGSKSSSPKYPQLGSLLATASVGALSGLDLDSQLGWSSADLDELLEEEDGGGGAVEREKAQPQTAAVEQLMSLLGLCSTARLHHVAPAPFGDLVIALNLKDATT